LVHRVWIFFFKSLHDVMARMTIAGFGAGGFKESFRTYSVLAQGTTLDFVRQLDSNSASTQTKQVGSTSEIFCGPGVAGDENAKTHSETRQWIRHRSCTYDVRQALLEKQARTNTCGRRDGGLTRRRGATCRLDTVLMSKSPPPHLE